MVSSSAKLDYQMGYLVVRKDTTTKIHLGEIRTLLIESTAVSLTAALLAELVKKKVKVIFCDEKRNPSAEMMPYYGSHDCSLKIKRQTAWPDDIKGAVWTEIVLEKIRQQKCLLQELGKNEAMLKFTSKLSVGLDMTWNEDGNEYLGMFVCGNSLIERGITEIPQVMNRENIGFSFISGCMDLPCAENLLTDHEEAGVFACTKEFLLEHTLPPVNRNAFALELALQAEAPSYEFHDLRLHPPAVPWNWHCRRMQS